MAGRDSVFAVALGANYQLTEKLAIRGGYQYNTNPLASTSDAVQLAIAGDPSAPDFRGKHGQPDRVAVHVQGLRLWDEFKNAITGTAREIPEASIQLSAASHANLFNLQIKYGSCGREASCSTASAESAPVSIASYKDAEVR